MVIIDVEQKTDDWYKVRELKLTASHAQTIMANGKGLETYCKELVAEYLSEDQKSISQAPILSAAICLKHRHVSIARF